MTVFFMPSVSAVKLVGSSIERAKMPRKKVIKVTDPNASIPTIMCPRCHRFTKRISMNVDYWAEVCDTPKCLNWKRAVRSMSKYEPIQNPLDALTDKPPDLENASGIH